MVCLNVEDAGKPTVQFRNERSGGLLSDMSGHHKSICFNSPDTHYKDSLITIVIRNNPQSYTLGYI